MLTATDRRNQLDQSFDEAAPANAIVVATTDVAGPGASAGTFDDEFFYLDRELRAAQDQMRRGAQELTEGIIRLSIALTRMDTTRAYLRAGFSTFSEYVEGELGISRQRARRYIDALRSLGEAAYRDLLMSLRAKRTFVMAQIQNLDPEEYDRLLMPADADGAPLARTMPVDDLKQVVADLRTKIAQQEGEKAQLQQQARQAHALSKTANARLADFEQMNGKVVEDLDRAQQALEDEEKAHKSALKELGKVKRELGERVKELEQRLATAQAAPLPPAAAPAAAAKVVVEEVVQVVASCDPTLLADLVRFATLTLRRYHDLMPRIAPGDAGDLYAAIADLVAGGDLALLIPVLNACARGLRHAPEPARAGEEVEHNLQNAIGSLGATVRARYPGGVGA